MVPNILSFAGHIKEEQFGKLSHWILNGPIIGLGFSPRRLWSWAWFEMQVLRSMPRLRSWKPEIVIVSSLSLLTFLSGIVIKSLFRIPLLVEVRDVYPLTLVEIGGYKPTHPAIRVLAWVEKMGYKYADGILSSLPNLEPHVEEVLGYPKPVKYLPMGYDPEYYEAKELSEKGKEALIKISSLKATFIAGYSGTIGKANALLPTLQAFEQLHNERPDIHLVLIGDGPLRRSYEEDYGKYSNIHFLGRLKKSDLPFLLQRMQLLLNPWHDQPIYRFGISPNKWIDYMMAGRPILAPYSGYPLLLEKEDIGWFIKPDDTAAIREYILKIAALPKEVLNGKGAKGKAYLQDHLNYNSLAQELMEAIRAATPHNTTKAIS